MYDAAGSSVVDWNYTNRAVSGSSDYYKKETSGNANLSIGELSGNEGKPVYLMIDGTKNENKINITINSTNARPLVIIYTGTTKNNNKNNYKPLTLNIFGSVLCMRLMRMLLSISEADVSLRGPSIQEILMLFQAERSLDTGIYSAVLLQAPVQRRQKAGW